MRRIRRTSAAKADLAGIWKYIAMDNLDAAERWLENIDDKLKLLAEFPGAGPRRDDLAPGVRSFTTGNYLIFYREQKDAIEVIRVLHGARDLPEIFGE